MGIDVPIPPIEELLGKFLLVRMMKCLGDVIIERDEVEGLCEGLGSPSRFIRECEPHLGKAVYVRPGVDRQAERDLLVLQHMRWPQLSLRSSLPTPLCPAWSPLRFLRSLPPSKDRCRCVERPSDDVISIFSLEIHYSPSP